MSDLSKMIAATRAAMANVGKPPEVISEDSAPDSTGLTSRHLEKALNHGGYPGTQIIKSHYVGPTKSGKSHQYHCTFKDDHSLENSGNEGHIGPERLSAHVYVSKDANGVHKAEF